MRDISWIILSIGLAIIAILLAKPLWINKKNHSRIKINNKFIINDAEPSKENQKQIIALRFSPKIKNNISFDEAMQFFMNHNLSFNNMQIFEKKDNNKILFNVANLIEPGTFDKSEDIPGFTFFFQRSSPEIDLSILHEMIETMQELSKYHDAWILDDDGNNIDHNNLNKLLTINE